MNETGKTKLTEGEHSALKAIAEAEPIMPDIRKGYFLGYADALVDKKIAAGRAKDQPGFEEEQ